MRKFLNLFSLVCFGVISAFALPQAVKGTSKTDAPAQQSKATIEGLLRSGCDCQKEREHAPEKFRRHTAGDAPVIR